MKTMSLEGEEAIGRNEGEHLDWIGLMLIAVVLFCMIPVGLPALWELFKRRLFWCRVCAWCKTDLQRPLVPFKRYWTYTHTMCPDCCRTFNPKAFSTETKNEAVLRGPTTRYNTPLPTAPGLSPWKAFNRR